METGISIDQLIPYMVPAFVVLFTLYAALSMMLHFRRAKKSHQFLIEYAKSKGYKYPGVSKAFMGGHSAFKLFSRGRRPSIGNVLTGGINGVEFEIFNFSYRTGSGKNNHTRRITVFAFIFQGKSIPQFVLTPEGLFDKLAGALGGQDIDFPDHPKFSGTFKLSGESEEQIRRIFTFPLLEELCKRKDISIEGQGESLLFFVDYKAVPVDKWELALEDYSKLSKMFRV